MIGPILLGLFCGNTGYFCGNVGLFSECCGEGANTLVLWPRCYFRHRALLAKISTSLIARKATVLAKRGGSFAEM